MYKPFITVIIIGFLACGCEGNFNLIKLLISYRVNHVLLGGPEQHRSHFKQLIEIATQSIEIYQQALQDEEITNLLVEAIRRGVKVSILMSKFPFGAKHGNKSEACQKTIQEASGEVRLTGALIKEGELAGKKLHIHAKIMLIDIDDPQKAIMCAGSANFYAPALDRDRNLSIITKDHSYINPVRKQFRKDWQVHEQVADDSG